MKQIVIFIATLLMIVLAASARQPERGYRGFLDWDNSFYRVDTWMPGNKTTAFYTGISTSHGYQISPLFYVGAGISFEHCGKFDNSYLTPFVHGRSDFRFGRVTPFGEVRLGYNLTNGGGVFFSPNVGYRFNWGRKMGVNLGLGLSLYGYSADIYEPADNPVNGYDTYVKVGVYHGCRVSFSFRVGIDF